MAKQADVELRIRSRDLSKRSIEEVTKEIEALNAKLREQKDAATIAATAVKQLKGQQKLLSDAAANLNSRRSDIEALQRQQAEIAQTTAALNKYRAELAELRRIQSSGNYLGDIDKAIKEVGRSVNSSSKLLNKQQTSFDRAANKAREYGVDVEDLAGSLRRVESLQENVSSALDEANGAFERREQALREIKTAEEQQVARQKEIEAAVRRRAAAEVAASERATAAARQAAAEQERIAKKRADSIAAFTRQRDIELGAAGAARELEIQQRLNTVLERRERLLLAARQVANRDREVREIELQRRATARLAEIEQRAANVAKRLQQTRGVNTRGLVQSRTATDRAAQAQRRLNDQNRTALNFNQRLRGQILSIAAAYFGVFEAINTVRRAINADIERQGTMMRLTVAAEGDTRQAGRDFEYVREQADRLGQRLEPLGAQYSKFAIAAQGAGQSLETTRQVFEDFTEVATVLQLSQENVDGIFKALEQSFSKGIIQAEELRGQLGDRLPGAFTKLAQAIGLSNGEMTKLMENGELTADVLPLLAEFMADEVASKLPEATRNTRAELARLRTAFDEFLITLGRGGLSDTVRELSMELSEFFRSEDGRQFAESIAQSFSMLVNSIRTVVGAIGGPNGIISALKAMIAIKVAMWVGQWAQGLGVAIRQLTVLRGAMTATTVSARTMGRAISVALGPIGIAVALLAEAFFYLKMRSDAAADAIKRKADRIDELRRAQGQALSSAVDLAEQDVEIAKQARDAAAAKREQARATLENARAQLAELKASGNFVQRFGRNAGDLTPQAKRQIQAITEAERAIADAEVAIGEYNRTAAEASVARDRLRRESWQNEADALREFAAIEKELNDETNRQKFLSDKAYYDSVNDRAREAFQTLSEASRDYVKQSTLDQQDALQQMLGRLRAERLGLDISRVTQDGDDNAKALREAERLARERARLAERAADELKRIDREVLEAHAETVEGRLALLDFEMDERSASLRELQADLEAAMQQAQGVEAEMLRARAAAVAAAASRFEDGGDIRARRTTEETQEGTHDEFVRREQELNQLVETRAARIEYINALREAGQLTQIEAERQARDAMLAGQDAIAAKAVELRDFLIANQGLLGEMMNVDAVLAQLDQLTIKINIGDTASKRFLYTWREEISSGFAEAFGTFAEGIAGALQGVNDWSDAFKAAGDAFLNFAADFLVNIGKMIMQAILLKAIQNAISGGTGGYMDAAMGVLGVAHNGAIVGAPMGSKMAVSPLVFAGAPRYHSGGFPGLRSDEVPIIAQTGEEVLSRTDPRNALNGGATPAAPQLKIINAIDSASVVNDALNRRDGQQPVLNMIRARKAEIKQILGV